jgi:Ankyrin repeats (3 copies)/Ankyrin repeat
MPTQAGISHTRGWLLLAAVIVSDAARCCPAARLPWVPAIPLVEAVRRGDVDTARLLLVRGADPETREMVLTKPSLADRLPGGQLRFADSVLMLAVQTRNVALIQLLLERGANIDQADDDGFTPLIEACRQGQPSLAVVKLLLEHGARPNVRTWSGSTAIQFAANEGQTKLVALLLRYGADVAGGSGLTPLMEAAYRGQEDLITLLIAKGADVNARFGATTALECARTNFMEEAAALIEKAGGKGRSAEAIRAESERQPRPAPLPEDPRLGTRERLLTAEDGRVIETVLRDLLADRRILRRANPVGPDIILVNTTSPLRGIWEIDGINFYLTDRQANDFSMEMREHFLERNGAPISLADFQPKSAHILLRSEAEVGPKTLYFNLDRFVSFRERYPAAKAWVQCWLPSYSARRDEAYLAFAFGPSAHGAHGACFLTKRRGVWRVRWRYFGFRA